VSAVKRVVAYNEIGRRIGQDHPRAKLTDGDVELTLRLHEEGWGYGRIASKLGASKSHVRHIVKGHRRCQTPARYKAVIAQ
jgi:hypothetical protein